MRSRIASPEGFVLTLWTNDPAMAKQADLAGVDFSDRPSMRGLKVKGGKA